MPSAKTFRKLVRKGIRVDRCPYTSFDSLASEQDVNDLFSVLADFKDKNSNHPVITANVIMMNPDYDRIRSSGFRNYYSELFTEALKRYPAHNHSYGLWKKGAEEKLFFAQFHGREHLNVNRWMNSLRKTDSISRTIFDEEMFWPGSAVKKNGVTSIRAAFDTEDLSEVGQHGEIIREGLEQFELLFGYRSKSFIAPNFVYHPDLNKILLENNVQFLQGMKYQKLPMAGRKTRQLVRRIHGQMNEHKQHNLIRNCVFEPSQKPLGFDSVNECLKDLKNAFLWKKPAVITAHRLNFIGHIDPENREKNLKMFSELLKEMLIQWPDIEFMTSTALGKLIAKNK